VPGIGVITNPLSRQNKRNPRLAQRLGYILGEKGDFQQPTDLDALAATALRFKEADIDVLCINGGDGTMHTALTAMIKAYGDKPLPKIALLRGGTMNTVARGLGIRGTPASILEYVVQHYHTDGSFATKRRWLVGVDGTQYGVLFGNGLIARFLEEYYAYGDPTPVRAGWLLFRTACSALVGGALIQRLMTPFVGTAVVDGVSWPSPRYMTVAAGTCDDLGLGFRLFWKALYHPKKMHVVGISTMNPVTIVMELPRIWRARQVEGEGFQDDVASELVLRSNEPITYMVDGDFHRGGTELVVRVGPHVDFIVPEGD
jgi:diacylglycerol kinase (ATP)